MIAYLYVVCTYYNNRLTVSSPLVQTAQCFVIVSPLPHCFGARPEVLIAHA